MLLWNAPKSPTGQDLSIVIGSQGDVPGKFQQPRGITGLADGSFVVVDRAARVQHFSADGLPLKLWSMQEHAVGNPKGLCALPNGNLLVCDTHYGRVLEMKAENGMIVQIWGEPGLGPAQFTHPLSAAVDAARGVAYVVEYGGYNDRVQKFSLDGKFLKSWGSFGSEQGQFQRPSGIAVDGAGNVYVADSVNHRIQKFNSEGVFLTLFGSLGTNSGELRYPYDIAWAPDEDMETKEGKLRASNGLLYVIEFCNHRVSVFDTNGIFVRDFGGAGTRKGEFANPWSLTIDARGRLLVSDTANNRVQIFDLAKQSASPVTRTLPRLAGREPDSNF